MISPKNSRPLRSSYSSYATYQMALHYCISFQHYDTAKVLEICGDMFNEKLTCTSKGVTIMMTTNSDFAPTTGIIFLSGLSFLTECSKSANALTLNVDPEKMLTAQSENACGIRQMKKLYDKLTPAVTCEIGWQSFVCKWKD